jgi:hypothetical protein
VGPEQPQIQPRGIPPHIDGAEPLSQGLEHCGGVQRGVRSPDEGGRDAVGEVQALRRHVVWIAPHEALPLSQVSADAVRDLLQDGLCSAGPLRVRSRYLFGEGPAAGLGGELGGVESDEGAGEVFEWAQG